MALMPNNFTSKYSLQPGARGELFQPDLPGYRGQGNRINRTNMALNTTGHEATNITYSVDSRLPVLFRYGFAYGFNQIVITKGRIVGIDPARSVVDFEDKKPHNILTIANGGNDVDLSGTSWTKASTAFSVDPSTGLDAMSPKTKRPANKPAGIIMRNEYTRDDGAFNGIAPGAVLTDCMVQLPWFAEQEKAEENPWGSAYGTFKPGDLVKSDTNGRFVVSPLNDPDIFFGTPADITATVKKLAEYEKERQQIIGEIYETFPELVPAGAAIYAQWALTDREQFNEFNPDVFRQNNRDGEDSIPNSPYNSSGNYPGYPYERGYMADDLHMINDRQAGGRGGVYDPRLQLEYQMRNGIPGLSDGFNAVKNYHLNTYLGNITQNATATTPVSLTKGERWVFRFIEVNVQKSVITLAADLADNPAMDAAVQTKVGDFLDTNKNFIVSYLDNVQGLVGISVAKDCSVQATQEFKCSYVKNGVSGVPTNLDWDGCKGTVKILLQK